ncbi:GIY-YIG nuclease family protein [Mycobacteroides salmoniphilum]|uniref:GIY-YIG domain-containing protein n=1 Tax=Mycobacteroides salmoniphilum TaxID=404941 RepID=A0A4R8SXJ9_9MYCO|nr:GIY-YIG nuclease family protein [Mycobacteroides salmoniphilum]TDZ89830.1 hypothetical protein CCUG62472_04769 [Mycobacteroides salmoniphilum]TEA08004.1 hypothetical protein CCUG60884_00483 [Mycobacteroides salmoniphilum]
MSENQTSHISKGKLLSVRECHRIWPARQREGLDQRFLEARPKRLPSVVKALAVLAAVAIPLSGVQPSAAMEPVASAAEQFGRAATAAFSTSELGRELAGDAVLPPVQRAAGIPTDTSTGWDLPTTDGRSVQLVPPGGLASGQITAAGQVVYSDAGAGYDVLAENTAIGKRMVTRISGPEKTRTVTMFLRTPADTVMLAHVNGFLSVNSATAEAETLAMFAPSEVRDSKGALVPSAYITQQLQPNLYLLSQVISPDAGTEWPVYADPFGIDIPNPITAAKNAVASVANAGEQLVNKAVEVAAPAVKTFAAANAQLASQAWSGIKTGANYVKENPLEFAQIVGGTALVASGVGSGFGAGLITSGVSGLVNKAAEANPDNQWLQVAGVVTEAATYIGPGGITKKGLQELGTVAKEGVENLAQKTLPKLTTKADDAAKAVVPTPATKLAEDIPASVGKTPQVPANPAATPKTPKAPPAKPAAAPESECGCLTSDARGGIYRLEDPASKQTVRTGMTNDLARREGEHARSAAQGKLPEHDFVVVHKTDDQAELRGLEQEVKEKYSSTADRVNGGYNKVNGIGPNNPKKSSYEGAAQQHHQTMGQARGQQTQHARDVTNKQRARAVDGAHQNGAAAGSNKTSGSSGGTTAHHDGSGGGGSHSKSSGSKKNNKGNGKGNRSKRSRTGRH